VTGEPIGEKPLPWLRLYLDILDEPKVQTLPDKLFKFWINCLLLTGKNLGSLPSPEDIAFSFRMKKPTVDEYLRKLFDADLLDLNDGTYIPHAWDKRQYKSDLSTDRVKRFRASKGNVPRNVSETLQKRPVKHPQITDSREQKNIPPTPPLFPDLDDAPEDLARDLYAMWPEKRRNTLKGIMDEIVAILSTSGPNAERDIARIRENAKAYLDSQDDLEFCMGLAKWLRKGEWQNVCKPVRDPGPQYISSDDMLKWQAAKDERDRLKWEASQAKAGNA